LVCDGAPDNTKKLTAIAAKTGLDAGLGQLLEAKMRKFQPSESAEPPH
jgi:hypothetical protein